MRRILQKLVMLLYPREVGCMFCGAFVAQRARCVCAACAKKLPCRPRDRSDVQNVTRLQAAYAYEEPIRQAIIEYKYNFKRYYARFFAYALAALELPENAVLVEVPLHKKRRRERKFSQTVELCNELREVTGIAYTQGLLIRTRDTPKQSLLTVHHRANNVLDAFQATTDFTGQLVVLVDDVASTGATLSQCAAAVKAAGASEVWAIVIAM